MTEGSELISAGRFAEAVEFFNKQKLAHPSDARAYFFTGMALAETGRLGAAAAELNEAIRLQPAKPEFYILRANILTRLGHQTPAAEDLEKAGRESRLEELSPSWLWLLSDTYYRLTDYGRALKVLESLEKKTPRDSRIDLNRGQIQAAQGDSASARKFLQSSLEKNSTSNSLAYFELGKILHRQGELEQAKGAFLKAVEQSRDNPEYLFRLGTLHLTLNELEKAIQYLRKAEPAGAQFPEIHYNLGRAYQKQGEREAATRQFERFQKIKEAQEQSQNRGRELARLIAQAEVQMDDGREAEARALLEKAVSLDPASWEAHAYLAEMLLASADWQQAEPHLLEMEAIDPLSVIGNYLAAGYWHRRAQFERARLHAERARTARPANAELRNLLGRIYTSLGLKELALAELEAAVRLAPEASEYRQDLERIR